MKIVFEGLDHPIELRKDQISTLVVENRTLYARICESLISEKGDAAREAYTVWDETDREIRPRSAFLVVESPFSLPWKHRALAGQLHNRIAALLLENEEIREEVQRCTRALNSELCGLSFQLHGDYDFGAEWDLVNYLKMMAFDREEAKANTLLENLIQFIELASDVGNTRAIVFINMRTFLEKKELLELVESILFHETKALFLENKAIEIYSDLETEYVIDQRFIEYVTSSQSKHPSPTQGRICSNGFGAVTF